MVLLITGAVSLVVGLLIGWCGVAGFLLPLFFTGYLGMAVAPSLAVSFLCFAVSGAIGSIGYKKAGQLPLRPGLWLGGGSLLGAALGAMLNSLIPASSVKLLLYIVVLFSGLSILLRKDRAEKKQMGSGAAGRPVLLVPLGFVTGLICALSGAGGPVLVMPLLLLLGMPPHAAVGVSLFDSLFIALPALGVYLSRSTPELTLLVVCAASHGVGVLFGSRTAHKVPSNLLKRLVGIFSVCTATYMLITLLIRK